MGGYVSLPVCIAAWSLGIPLVLHEQNVVLGLANRVCKRFARRVAVSFEESLPHAGRKGVFVGNPVLPQMADCDRDAERKRGLERFDIAAGRPTLLVFGGSQGARSINQAIISAHQLWGETEVQILHATGRATYEVTATGWAKVRDTAGGSRVRVLDFIESMADAYAAADLVVCRSGATSIAELTALGIPAVLVPYPHATADHQTENALALARAGGAFVIEDGDLDGATLVEVCRPLLSDPDRLAEVADASRAFGRPDAAANVARLVPSLLEGRVGT
jgi:UDP-N-acetylglucosamine--N-acetylmuramyl-(pentapeptide) pyrophosphoryl-undecaprenol N-acetylglucosamine transferase